MLFGDRDGRVFDAAFAEFVAVVLKLDVWEFGLNGLFDEVFFCAKNVGRSDSFDDVESVELESLEPSGDFFWRNCDFHRCLCLRFS